MKVPPDLDDAPRIEKPVSMEQCILAVAAVLGGRRL
jgi:hypothetical protein